MIDHLVIDEFGVWSLEFGIWSYASPPLAQVLSEYVLLVSLVNRVIHGL